MEWQPIETAPRDGAPILIYGEASSSGGCPVAMARWDKKYSLWKFQTHAAWGSKVKDNPTHWMPLPGASTMTHTRPRFKPTEDRITCEKTVLGPPSFLDKLEEYFGRAAAKFFVGAVAATVLIFLRQISKSICGPPAHKPNFFVRNL